MCRSTKASAKRKFKPVAGAREDRMPWSTESKVSLPLGVAAIIQCPGRSWELWSSSWSVFKVGYSIMLYIMLYPTTTRQATKRSGERLKLAMKTQRTKLAKGTATGQPDALSRKLDPNAMPRCKSGVAMSSYIGFSSLERSLVVYIGRWKHLVEALPRWH